jgi:hypothetical protein
MVGDRVLSSGAAGVPGGVRDTLREALRANAVRAAFLAGRQREIVEAMARKRIPALAFKGPALAADAYGDVALRSYDDLDLLVPADAFAGAVRCLTSLGYVRDEVFPVDAHTRGGWDCTLWAPDRTHAIEVGVSGMPRYFFRIAPGDLWSATESKMVGGGRVSVPARDVLVVLLCAHGTKHAWSRMGWVVDLAMLLESGEERDWFAALRLARRCGAARMLRVALVLAEELCDLSVPDDIATDIESDAAVVPWVVDDVLGRIRAGSMSEPFGRRLVAFHLRCRERWRDRLRYLFLLAVLPGYSDWKDDDLPHYWMYYVRRPFRMARRAMSRIRPSSATR